MATHRRKVRGRRLMASLIHKREDDEPKSIGLPPRGFNAFQLHAPIEGRVPATKPQKKTGPKLSKQEVSLMAISTPEERAAMREQIVLRQKTQGLHIGSDKQAKQADEAKRARLVGRNHPSTV